MILYKNPSDHPKQSQEYFWTKRNTAEIHNQNDTVMETLLKLEELPCNKKHPTSPGIPNVHAIVPTWRIIPWLVSGENNHGDRKFCKDRVSLVLNGLVYPLNEPGILSGIPILQTILGIQPQVASKKHAPFRGFVEICICKNILQRYMIFLIYTIHICIYI